MAKWEQPGAFRFERLRAEAEKQAKRNTKRNKAELATKLASEILFSPRKRPLAKDKEQNLQRFKVSSKSNELTLPINEFERGRKI